jgi:pimeloyl-ACP methyl ester carboxylesterase
MGRDRFAALGGARVRLADVAPVPGVAHRDVQVRDVRLHVAEAGAGPPLIMLHGWPQHWWSWRHLIPAFAQSYRVLVPDLRGFGWSDAPSGDYAKSSPAADVLALLDAEGISTVRIIGHDWGGYLALLLALGHPSRVERLVALDIAPPWPGRPRPLHLALPLVGAYQALLATPRLGAWSLTSNGQFVRSIIRAASGPGANWTDDELDIYADVPREPARARASSACYRTFLTHELPRSVARGDRSSELRVPSLLAMGAASPLGRVLDPQPGPMLRVEIIPGAGHFLPEEAPQAVTELAAPFLAGEGA